VGETSTYYVPESDTTLLGNGDELIERFWDRGLFLATPDDRIYRRVQDWRNQGRELPTWEHDFGFASMGLVESLLYHPVPNMPYGVCCPQCETSVFEAAMDIWQRQGATEPVPERLVPCPTCGVISPSSGLASRDSPFTFARVYFWVSDIGDDFDSSFRRTVESVLGPCREYTGWET
jgi:hypothetical protein